MISVAFYDIVELEAQKREQQKLDYLMEEMSEAKSLVRSLIHPRYTYYISTYFSTYFSTHAWYFTTLTDFYSVFFFFFFFKQKTAYEITRWLEFRRVLFRSPPKDELQESGLPAVASGMVCLPPTTITHLKQWQHHKWKSSACITFFALTVTSNPTPAEIGRASCRERV